MRGRESEREREQVTQAARHESTYSLANIVVYFLYEVDKEIRS